MLTINNAGVEQFSTISRLMYAYGMYEIVPVCGIAQTVGSQNL